MGEVLRYTENIDIFSHRKGNWEVVVPENDRNAIVPPSPKVEVDAQAIGGSKLYNLIIIDGSDWQSPFYGKGTQNRAVER